MAVTKRKSNRSAIKRFSKLLAQLMQRVLGSARLRPCKAQPKASPQSASLRSLTLAALALPGLVALPAYAADEDSVDFQYSHYQEGKRDLLGANNDLHPIEVYGVHGGAKISLSDRAKLSVNYAEETWSGATPRINTPVSSENIPYTLASASPKINSNRWSAFIDANHKIRLLSSYDPDSGLPNYTIPTWIHTLSTASPETRKQIDLNFRYQWDEAEVSAGGGVSVERDYKSYFTNIGLLKDFNQKLTSLNVGLSYTNSDTTVKLSQFDLTYIDSSAYRDHLKSVTYGTLSLRPFAATVGGVKDDIATTVGITQILSKDAQIQTGFGYTHSNGLMSNPYKAVMVAYIDPAQVPNAEGLQPIILRPVLEKRPENRNQLSWKTQYAQHINAFDAALHLGYGFYHDDWGINAHTFDVDWAQPLNRGWTVTPRVRYYSQSAADFYKPYFLMNHKAPLTDGTVFKGPYYDPNNFPKNYSSDQRLSAFGSLSGGLTIAKQFNRGLSLEVGYEYYTHAGKLKMGGGGESEFADFNYHTLNAALKLDLDKIGSFGGGDGHYNTASINTSAHGGHVHHIAAPAGVLFDHMVSETDGFMLGYRYMHSREGGDRLSGTRSASDVATVANGCPVDSSGGCRIAPTEMSMNMHMLELMYAPTDWLNLMVMPQFSNMKMSSQPLDGAPEDVSIGGHHGDGGRNHEHATGGLGDTEFHALFKLYVTPVHRMNLGLGLSAPTGDVDLKIRKLTREEIGFTHYGMQLGSGTWDFKPSLTYVGQSGNWSWGAQVSGTKRLQSKNKSGYSLGNVAQTSAWAGRNLTDWLSASVRGLYTWRGAIHHQYKRALPKGYNDFTCDYILPENYDDGTGNIDMAAYAADLQACIDGNSQAQADLIAAQNSQQRASTADQPSNYGGNYFDVGFGLNLSIPNGAFAGQQLSIEWLQPVYTNVNGYQLDRKGSLALNWSMMF